MGTVLEKANKIKETKNKLKEVINDGGGQITNNTVFNDYANEIKDIYIDAINNGTENIYDNFPKITGEGNEITLNTEKGPLKITLEGNTSQDGTPTPDAPVPIKVVTGENNVKVENKNLLDFDDFLNSGNATYTENNGNYIITNIGNLVLNRYVLKINANKTYTLSCTKQEQTSTNVRVQIYKDNVFIGSAYVTGTQGNSFTFTVQEGSIYTMNLTYSTFDTNIIYKNPMLELNSTATEYVEHQEQNYPISLSSKNLLNFTLTASVEKNGITFTKNSDGSLTLNGTATTTFTQVFNITNQILNGTYTIKHNVLNGTTSENSYLSIQKSPSGNISDRVYGGTGSSTLSITEDTTIITASLYITSGTTFIDYNVGSQLEVGETATAYEPYYNIEYCKIGDYADQFIRTNGKNLFNIEGNINTRYNGTIGNYNSLEGNNLITTYSTNDGYPYGQRIYVGAGKKVTISGVVSNINATGSKSVIIMCFNDNTTTGAQSTVFDNTEINIRKSFSFTADTDYVIVTFAGRYSGFVSAIFTNIQVEYGETLSEYEPYGLNEWYLKKNIDKVIFDGSDDEVYEQVYGSIYNNKCIFYLRNIPHNNSNYQLMKSNRFTATAGVSEYYPEGINTSYNSGFLGLVLIADRLTEYSANALKTFFQNNNTDVYLIALTPTYIHISQENYPILKTELDNLYNNAKSYSDATIIECSSINDDNETIQASIIALKNIDLIESE